MDWNSKLLNSANLAILSLLPKINRKQNEPIVFNCSTSFETSVHLPKRFLDFTSFTLSVVSVSIVFNSITSCETLGCTYENASQHTRASRYFLKSHWSNYGLDGLTITHDVCEWCPGQLAVRYMLSGTSCSDCSEAPNCSIHLVVDYSLDFEASCWPLSSL